MLEFFYEYGLFLAKTLTILFSVLVVVGLILSMQQRGRRDDSGHLEVTNLNERLQRSTDILKQAILSPQALKLEQKAKKTQATARTDTILRSIR